MLILAHHPSYRVLSNIKYCNHMIFVLVVYFHSFNCVFKFKLAHIDRNINGTQLYLSHAGLPSKFFFYSIILNFTSRVTDVCQQI